MAEDRLRSAPAQHYVLVFMTPANAYTLFSTQAVPVLSNLRKSVLRCCPSLLPLSSHSSSALAVSESTVSKSNDGLNGTANNTTKSESAEYDGLLPSEVTDFGWDVREDSEEPRLEVAPKLSLWEEDLQPGNARTEQESFAERNSSFVMEEKSDGSVELDSQATPMHFIPMADSAEREVQKLIIGQAASALSSPFSPSESVRPLTPHFPDTDESKPLQNVSSSLVSSVTVTADDGRKAGRKHLGFDASPTNDASYLFPPLPMPDQRRYSLMDLGSRTAPTADRRTLSDVGACTTSLHPQTGLPSDNASEELEEFRTSLPPSTVRFSTFAEMGIQSFAMSKGEKTVDSKKKETKAYDKRRHKKIDGAGNVAVISKERNRHFLEPTNPIGAQEKNVVVLDSPTDAIVAPAAAETHHRGKMYRSPKLKSADCIVM